ncbi:hypothetical protein ACM26V_05600 [Salipaludibacillus sp. HK11]|uniref:hypothetical protein n=1 Tax=Salipaludibacillus sp. HK11 TaxID=3394320 RepID=UPI0039FDA50D
MNWSHCKKLILFEMRHTPVYYYLMNMVIAIIVGWLLSNVLPDFLVEEKTAMIVDFLFIIGLSVNIYLLRPYSFFIRKIKSQFYVAPIQILIRQMPISQLTNIVSRFISSCILGLFSSMIFLSSFYFFMSANEIELLFPNYFSFSLIWILLVVGNAGLVAASEPGDHMTNLYMSIWWIVLLIVGIGTLLIVRFTTGNFVFEWVVIGAREMPILLPVMIIPVAGLCNLLWVNYMKKYLDKTDYHI